MKSRVLVASFGVFVVVAVGLQARQARDLSSPKATAKTFVDAVRKHDVEGIADCIVGGKPSPDLSSLLEADRASHDVTVKSLIAEESGDSARVGLELDWVLNKEGAKGLLTLSATEILTLKREGDVWRIVPDADMVRGMATDTERYSSRILNRVAVLVVSPGPVQKMMNEAHESAKGAVCLSNAKQLGLGVMMYVQDYDEVYPRKTPNYKPLIFPYVKNDSVFRCPGDTKQVVSYRFNKGLQGRSLAEVAHADKTVMLYEGNDSGPIYRHEGKAAIVFADGRAAMKSSEEVKQAIWTLPAKKPVPQKAKRRR